MKYNLYSNLSTHYSESKYLKVFQNCFLMVAVTHDLTNCNRRFNVDIMKLYISGRDHARKLKFSSYVHLPSVNKIFQYHYA